MAAAPYRLNSVQRCKRQNISTWDSLGASFLDCRLDLVDHIKASQWVNILRCILLALESGCSVQQKWGITSLYLQIRNRSHVSSIQLTFWYFKKMLQLTFLQYILLIFTKKTEKVGTRYELQRWKKTWMKPSRTLSNSGIRPVLVQPTGS